MQRAGVRDTQRARTSARLVHDERTFPQELAMQPLRKQNEIAELTVLMERWPPRAKA
jgi:hypothetical protein